MLIFLAVALIFVNTVLSSSELYCVDHHTQTLTSCKSKYRRPVSAFATKPNKIITFDLNCQANPDDCQGVQATFEKAIEIISSVIQLETSLIVNATYNSFCSGSTTDCSHSTSMSAIGQAFPTISYIMTDSTDNVTRMYPQALLKQFTQLPIKPGWAHYDINAQFNSGVNWYFVNNPNPIKENQTDFLRNVVHELFHGLGFLSSWSNILYTNMSPLIDDLEPFATPMSLATMNQDPIKNFDRPFPFWGFIEYPFDKLVYTENTSLTSLGQKLNQFGQSNTLFRNALDFANAWYTSDAYPVASQLYHQMVTTRDLWIQTDDTRLWLESSLNPFSPGSSLSHVDSSYENTTEFLMIYRARRGLTAHNIIGPDLQRVMAILGYRIKGLDPVQLPQLSYWNPSNNLAGSSSNPSPSLASKTGPAHSPVTSSATSFSCLSATPSMLICIIHILILLTLVL